MPITETHNKIAKPNSNIVEATVFLKKGASIRVSDRTDSMFSSIDLVSKHLSRQLRKHRQKTNHVKGSTNLKTIFHTIQNTPGIQSVNAFLKKILRKWYKPKFEAINEIDRED